MSRFHDFQKISDALKLGKTQWSNPNVYVSDFNDTKMGTGIFRISLESLNGPEEMYSTAAQTGILINIMLDSAAMRQILFTVTGNSSPCYIFTRSRNISTNNPGIWTKLAIET